MSDKIGLFYGSSTCYTEFVAEKIQQQVGEDRVDLFDIATTPLSELTNYEFLIFGIPTWDYGELQEDWDRIWDDMDRIDLSGKTCAIFGLGDQQGYPTWYQDALGYLYHKLRSMNATLIGQCPTAGHEFETSKGLSEDEQHFLGLALDEENQPELTDQRIDSWLQQILG